MFFRWKPETPGSDDEGEAKKPRRSQRIQGKPAAEEAPAGPSKPKNVKAHKKAGKSAPEPAASDHVDKDRLPPPPVPVREELTPISSSPGPQLEPTQLASQFYCPPPIDDEAASQPDPTAWGYLVPLNSSSDENRKTIKLNKGVVNTPQKSQHGTSKRGSKVNAASGFLIGRHAECDHRIDSAVISNRHCILYKEIKNNTFNVVLEDLSSNGTWINSVVVGRNHRRRLNNGDEIEIAGGIQFVFRYPQHRRSSQFRDEWELGPPLGSGHFATVYMATEKSTGNNYAVKVFSKRPNADPSTSNSLGQEIAVLQSVSHPNVLGLKNSYDEDDGVFLILELAPGGELFNYIIEHQKLSEVEARTVFKQLFSGLKYLHDRNIVHRDIKPENILITDKASLHVKLADFGLAKIIGEESFTTSLCGTPSYVAPEILRSNDTRRYDRAVDIWSLGVVLYICLCGFPPFSDELCTPEHPYNLSDQIRNGRYDFPSPYWDPVSDAALDLIEHMLEVHPGRRYTIDQCLEHPWLTGSRFSIKDSFSSVTEQMGGLAFSRKRVERERTLLAHAPGLRNMALVNPSKAKAKAAAAPDVVAASNGSVKKDKGKGKEKARSSSPAAAGGVTPRSPPLDVNTKAFMHVGGKGAEEILYSEGSTEGIKGTLFPELEGKGK
ncbi:Pkinase-domain-containing protein [Ascodesmis nigricans]|uniref:Pkinase-domain-containing protein n=1 Tax=Ascodesmis nigricans TaxID=341454 RepID=A0A4S2MP17_9PEZI|nr:Pkinase-domain-containing protein [Ascodesmis nigricans]